MIPQANITAWRAFAPWSDDAQVEQDLVLSRAVVELFHEPQLADHIALRGGTSLNKLFVIPASRYSEDIDLVQTQAGPAGPLIDAIRKKLDPWLGKPTRGRAEGGFSLVYRFESEIPPVRPLRLKIEINTREHFTVLGLRQQHLAVTNPWFTGAAEIKTYLLDELMGTKLRALFVRHILGVFAQFEREMIADRIAETRAYLKAHNRRLAGPVPLGYTADPKTKQLVVVPKEARRVRLIFDRAARGQTPAKIAARINHLKWRTKSWVAYRSGKMRGSGKWTARQVLYLLRNPVYTGQHREAHGARPGSHSPIVDQDLFDRVQTVLASRRTITNTTRRPLDFPLRGKIVCPKCGRRLSSQLSSRSLGLGRAQRRFYCCRSSAGGRAPCRGVRYPAYDLERFICQKLDDQTVWQGLLSLEQEDQATQYAAIWSGMGEGLQGDLIGQMVEKVTFFRKNTEMRITFTAQCREVISARIKHI